MFQHFWTFLALSFSDILGLHFLTFLEPSFSDISVLSGVSSLVLKK
jgi:hypothetical protein